MQVCTECTKLYSISHTCKAGECTHCHQHFKGIRDHNCPVIRAHNLVPVNLWRVIKDDAATCDGCGTKHFRSKHLHGLRYYKGVYLCANCYSIPQIEHAISAMCLQLTESDVRMGKTECAICEKGLIDIKTGWALAAFRRDYLDVIDKQCTVWALVNSGAKWDSVRTANDQCRNVCIRCHSALSIAKWAIGIQSLKKLQVPDCLKHVVTRKVETLVNMLVFQGTNNS